MTGLVALRDWGKRWTEPLGQWVAKTGISPNALTFTGFLVSVGAGIATGYGYFTLGGAFVLFAGAFDFLDGAVARATQRASRFGAFFDSTLDRLSEAAVLLGLLVWYTQRGFSQEIILIYVTIVGSLMVSYVRARAEGLGLQCQVGLFTRAERVILLAVGLLIHQVTVVLWVLAILTHLTVAQRIVHVWRVTKEE